MKTKYLSKSVNKQTGLPCFHRTAVIKEGDYYIPGTERDRGFGGGAQFSRFPYKKYKTEIGAWKFANNWKFPEFHYHQMPTIRKG